MTLAEELLTAVFIAFLALLGGMWWAAHEPSRQAGQVVEVTHGE